MSTAFSSQIHPLQQVFSLPELVILIIPHLSPPELFSCVQVCRHWHRVFLPPLWETVNDTCYSWPRILKSHDEDGSKGYKDEKWMRDIFTKYGHLIRHLSLSWKVSILAAGMSGRCTSLQSLTLTTSVMNKTAKELKALNLAMGLMPEEGGRPAEERARRGIAGPVLMPELEGLFLPRAAMWRTETEQERDWLINQHLWRLIYTNPTLKALRLALSEAELCEFRRDSGIHCILSSLKNILYLKYEARSVELDLLLEHIPTIRHIELSTLYLSDSFSSRSYQGLQTLYIQNFVRIKEFLEVLHSLPNLEHFHLIAIERNQRDFENIAKYMDNTPSRLKGLHFRIGRSFDFGQIASYILPWIPDLIELTLGWLDDRTACAISTHCKGFQVFRDGRDTKTTYSTYYNRGKPHNLELLLQKCPHLKVVDAIYHRVDADQILAQPWICHGLEVLHIQITGICRLTTVELKRFLPLLPIVESKDTRELTDNEQEFLDSYTYGQKQQQMIFSQLALMTRLRILDLGYEWRNFDINYSIQQYEINGQQFIRYSSPLSNTMELSLETGLDQLSDLVELEVFGFEGINHRIGKMEIKWIAAHWPRLRVMRGLQEDSLDMLEPDYERAELRKYMQELRPYVCHHSLQQIPELY